MDHFQAPRNMGRMSSPDAMGQATLNGQAPQVRIYLRIVDAKVAEATFETLGCGVMIAACSLLSVIVTNRSIRDCLTVTADDLDAALERIPPEKMYCARLPIEALHDALCSYRGCDKHPDTIGPPP
jgi:NifU-like protein involved in Fe-S cluster formation